MRDLNRLDLVSFNSEVEKKISRNTRNFFRTSALISSNRLLEFENRLNVKTNDSTDLLVLGIVSWYLPEEDGFLLRLELEEKIGNNLDLDWIRFVLNSKAEMLIFLQETSLWHTRDFFGNIITDNNLTRLAKLVKPKFKTKKPPRRLVRRRGYKDKGSLREIHTYHDFSIRTKELKELEQRRQSSTQTTDFLRGWFYGG